MSAAPPDVLALARALLHDQGAGRRAEEWVEAAERVLHRLAERLGPLVGAAGFRMLLQRALKRTGAERSWLAAIELDPESPWRLDGAVEAAREMTPEDAASAAAALLAELVGLIARFLGADMAIRLVRQSFPEVGLGGDTETGAEETIDE